MFRSVLMIAAVMLLAACSDQPRIVAKDTESFERSLQELAQTVEPEKLAALEHALKSLLFADIKNLRDLMEADEATVLQNFYDKIDGQTVDQVIEIARRTAATHATPATPEPPEAAPAYSPTEQPIPETVTPIEAPAPDADAVTNTDDQDVITPTEDIMPQATP